jgi:hypothetical protein
MYMCEAARRWLYCFHVGVSVLAFVCASMHECVSCTSESVCAWFGDFVYDMLIAPNSFGSLAAVGRGDAYGWHCCPLFYWQG